MDNILLLYSLLIVTLLCTRIITATSGEYRYGGGPQFTPEAIESLSRVFEIDKLPTHQAKHHLPPEYMTQLYKTVAFEDGVTKSRSPYDSDVVRGMPDRDPNHQMHFFFNVSHINPRENIIEAEFHLFKMKSRPPSLNSDIPRGAHLIDLKLYQVLNKNGMSLNPEPQNVQLLHHKQIGAHSRGWEVFKVKGAVERWIDNPASNFGFIVTATVRGSEVPVNGSYVRFAQRLEHHDTKQPVLVAFTEKRKTQNPDLQPDVGEGVASRQRYINYMNEAYRAEQSSNQNRATDRDRTAVTQHTVHSNAFDTAVFRNNEYRRSKRSVDRKRNHLGQPRKRKQVCSRHELKVDFDEIGWSGWIISPKGYNAYHCKGECPFPVGQNLKPTNHATVQSIVHAWRVGKNVGMPCCVPNKLYSISLLYFDEEGNVILKQYDDMVAASCGCQ